MSRGRPIAGRSPGVMVLGVGGFAYSIAQALKDDGARVCTLLTRSYGHYPPSLAGPVFHDEFLPNPGPLIRRRSIDVLIPQSIDWAGARWAANLSRSGAAIFSPTGEAMRIERERDFARRLCAEFKIPFPKAYLAGNRLEAERILKKSPRPYVIKNPFCSPTSPIHTILCESIEDTRSWLGNIDYAEGVFLQEYLGRAEAGHIALVSKGEIHSLATNQEYKRAFAGNMGVVAGAPLGGLVEQDPEDKYGLARQLLHPLQPWFRTVNYHGPIQVTAVRRRNKWHVIEYNVRIGIMSGPIIFRMLKNPADVVLRTARNRTLDPQFNENLRFGCSVTLAGYGYPYVQLTGPHLPLEVTGKFNCDVWWNEAALDDQDRLIATGHRIADVNALAATLDQAIGTAYANIRKIRCLGSYYRPDVGRSLWPPGKE